MNQIDGGYGWAVVFCCFYGHVTCIAAFLSLGVFLPTWVEEFDSSRGLVSLIMALAISVSGFIGPLVASLAASLGHRPVIMAGVVIQSLAVFLSAFANSIYLFIALIGVIGGIGFGVYNLTSSSVIVLYFNKRRALALSIVLSGTAIGNFLYPPFLAWLEQQMHWRGALIVMSSLMLQMAVFGALLRPLQLRSIDFAHKGLKKKSDGSQLTAECGSSNAQFESSVSQSHPLNLEKSKTVLKTNVNFKDDSDPTCEDIYFTWQDILKKEEHIIPSFERLQHQSQRLNVCLSQGNGPLKCHAPKACGQATVTGRGSSRNVFTVSNIYPYPNVHSPEYIPITKAKDSVHRIGELKIEANNLTNRGNPGMNVFSGVNEIFNGGINQESVNGKAMPSISQNITKAPTLTKAPALNSNTTPGLSTGCGSCAFHLKGTMALLKNPSFAVFAVSNFFTYLTYLMVPFYMADRAIENGVEKTKAALALSMYGAGSLCGRLGFGILADCCRIDALSLNCMCLIVCGVSTCLSPLCGANVILHGAYGFIFGTFIGAMVISCPIILGEILGKDKLSSALGVILMFRAVGVVLGTPVAGWIYDATGSYKTSFIIHGSTIIVSGLVILCLKVDVVRARRRKVAAATSFSNAGAVNKAFVSENSSATPKTVISTEL